VIDHEIWVKGHYRSFESGTILKLVYGFLFAFYSNCGRIMALAICEVFNVKEWHDLDILLKGRSRSLKMAPLDRPFTTLY